MAKHHGHFATIIDCMDGRTKKAVTELVAQLTGAEYTDLITWPGADKALAEDAVAQAHFERCVDISVSKHGSKDVFIFGHDDCAGNPVDRATHVRHEKEAAHVIRRRFPAVRVRHGHVDLIEGVWRASLNEE